MGGLLVKELKFRGLTERILIVTPANLTDQWRRELHEKFSESFTVINRGTVNSTYGRNVWEDNPQCITSIDFVARQDEILNLLRDVRWDLVIVDERTRWRRTATASRSTRPSATSSASSCGTAPTTSWS